MSKDHDHPHGPRVAAADANTQSAHSGAVAADAKVLESIFRIEAMDCPTEEALLRKRLSEMPGVIDLGFDLMRRQLTVQHSLPSIDPIVEAVASLGMKAEPAVSGVPDEAHALVPAESRESWWPLLMAGAAALYTSFSQKAYEDLFSKTLQDAVPSAQVVALTNQLTKLHGACKDPVPIEVMSATSARFKLPCERGYIEYELTVDAAGKLLAASAQSRNLQPPAANTQPPAGGTCALR